MALLNMTTEKNMQSSSWFEKMCFLASWWRPRSWPWGTPTAPQLRHKVLLRIPAPPCASGYHDWRKSVFPEIILKQGLEENGQV